MAVTIVTIPNTKPTLEFQKDHTIRKLLPIKVECLGCQEEVTDECPQCSNDIAPSNYVTCEGTLAIQFFFEDAFNTNPLVPVYGWLDWLNLTLISPNSSTVITNMADIAVSWWVTNVDGQSIQTMILDMPKICALIGDDTCFYFKIDICKKNPPCLRREAICGDSNQLPDHVPVGTIFFDPALGQLYQYIVGGWVGLIPRNGECIWCKNTGKLYGWTGAAWVEVNPQNQQLTLQTCDKTCFTDLYKIVRCEDVVCFESMFTKWDCIGYYYGVPDQAHTTAGGGLEPFSMRMCLLGSIERQSFSFEIEKTEDGTKTIKKTEREAARIRLWALSEFQSKKLANIFMGETWGIDGEMWDDNTAVEKNNDISNNWFPDITVTREICEKSSFTCDE